MVKKVLLLMLLGAVFVIAYGMDNGENIVAAEYDAALWRESCERGCLFAAFNCLSGVLTMAGVQHALRDTHISPVRRQIVQHVSFGATWAWLYVGCVECVSACNKPSYLYKRFAHRIPSYEQRMNDKTDE